MFYLELSIALYEEGIRIKSINVEDHKTDN